MSRPLFAPILRYCGSLLVILVLVITAFGWWAVGDQLPKRSRLDVEQFKDATPPVPPTSITLTTYNIAHGQGIKNHASDYRDKPTTLHHLELLADAIKRMDSDIFLLQEVDIDSKRTHHINQIEFIKERSGHAYHACANVWEKNYVPYPYWPVAHHIGHVRAANCVLSKFPLSNHHRVIFDKPESNPFWYNWAYIDRGIQRVDVSIGDKKIALLNLHLEAWGSKTREKQIKVVSNYMKEIDLPIILGGDFNTVNSDAIKLDNFADDPEANFVGEKTLSMLSEDVPELISGKLNKTTDNPFHIYSFPSNQPDRLLDYIFLLGPNMAFIDYRVGFEAGVASDHLPITTRIKYQ